jgi:hypothetical protein
MNGKSCLDNLIVFQAIMLLIFGWTKDAQSQEYFDRGAHIGATMITAPFYVTSEQQCIDLDRRLARKMNDISAAHDICLKSHNQKSLNGIGTRSLSSKSLCEHPSCQSLHDGRDDFLPHAEEQKKLCRAKLAEFQNEENSRRVREKSQELDRDLRRSKSNSCTGDWRAYKAVCTGEYESSSHASACKSELNHLRRRCGSER